jgi:hypothetical protein
MEVETMALNQWSKRSLILVAAICAVGGFLIGSSSSQESKPVGDKGEVGRYQMAPNGKLIFDTKTGQFWDHHSYEGLGGSREEWEEHAPPWKQAKETQ